MINMGKKSKLKPEEVISKALTYFGPSGVGLDIKEQSDCYARFEAMGGFVTVEAEKSDGKGSEVSIIGREFEYQIRQFIGEI
jgi:hypothetical protein